VYECLDTLSRIKLIFAWTFGWCCGQNISGYVGV
jgi:hypothetical protein